MADKNSGNSGSTQEQAGTVGKIASGIGFAAKKVIGWILSIASALGISSTTLVSIVVIIALIINALAGTQRGLVDVEGNIITSEGKQIINYFDRFVNYGQFDVSSAEATKYKNTYNALIDSGYEDELCALWKIIAYENVAYAVGWEQTQGYTDDPWNTDNSAEPGFGYGETAQTHFYSEYLRFYQDEDKFLNPEGLTNCRNADRSWNFDYLVTAYKNGITLNDSGDETTDSTLKKGTCYKLHYYYTNSLFRLCLDSMINETTNQVETSVKDLTKTEASKRGLGDETTEYLDLQDSIEKQQLEKIYKRACNLINSDKYKCHFQNYGSNGNGTTEVYKELSVREYIGKNDEIESAKRGSPVFRITTLTGDTSDEMFSHFQSVAQGFLITNASAQEIVQLAIQQIGNTYEPYCQEMNNGVAVDWCAIFCGWLLKHCKVELANVGYSSGCSTWSNSAYTNGIWRSSGAYTPKAGDFVFFGTGLGNCYHVGILTAVENNVITSVEGNSGSSSTTPYCLGSKVTQNTYQLSDSSIAGYISMSYRTSYGSITTGNIVLSNDDQALLDEYATIEYDSSYSPKKYNLTDEELYEVARVVTGEFGSSKVGMLLIAQCIRDALDDGDIKRNGLMNLKEALGYDACVNYKGAPSNDAFEAVNAIFTEGQWVVHHRILYMYAVDLCESEWHESQHFILQHLNVRFFDKW